MKDVDEIKQQTSYFSAVVTLVFALLISATAAYYSVTGLMAIFSGAAIAVAVMGAVLEVGKLVAASWLYNNWKSSPFLLKSYLSVAVTILMLITSMGIFGFLSKAHFETSAPSNNNKAKIEKLDYDISRQHEAIKNSEHVLEQFDLVLKGYVDKGYITKGLKARTEQTAEREGLQNEIKAANKEIDSLSEQKFLLEKEVRDVEVEVGPLKYVSELVYGTSGDIDKSVRLMIMILIFVFDPLAVLLVIAGNMSLAKAKEGRKQKKPKEVIVAVEKEEPVKEVEVVENNNTEYIPVYIEEELEPPRVEYVEVPVTASLDNVDVYKAIDKVFASSKTPFNLAGPEGVRLKAQLILAVKQEIRDSQTPNSE